MRRATFAGRVTGSAICHEASESAKPVSSPINKQIAVYDDCEKMAAFSGQGELFALPKFDPLDVPGLSDEAKVLGGRVQHGLFCIGSPATCIEFVQKHVDAGIDQLILPLRFGTLPQEQIMGSIRLFTNELIGKFSSNA